jgi:hypothetical protein
MDAPRRSELFPVKNTDFKILLEKFTGEPAKSAKPNDSDLHGYHLETRIKPATLLNPVVSFNSGSGG